MSFAVTNFMVTNLVVMRFPVKTIEA